MLFKRDAEAAILSGAQQIPVVAIIGPRQSGKSTLARMLFPKHAYIDLQDSTMFEFANQDPKGFLQSFKNDHGIIIDEAQYAPKLFGQIKVEADKDQRPGYFILSGSQNFLLHEKISESLAGRVYFYTLLPLSIHELEQADSLKKNITKQMYQGFYPRVYQPHIKPTEYYENYIATYVERDIRTIRNIDNILTFKKFMQLCALRIGSTLNLSAISTDCGITVNTAKSWIALLEASFILFLLPSYHNNLGKRVTKSPKLYFYDVGLAIALMGLDEESLIANRSVYGGLFENMTIVDFIKNFNAQSMRPTLTFYRDTNQKEIDLIIETKGKTIPVEIKASENMATQFFDTALWLKKEIGSNEQPIVIYGGEQTQKRTIGDAVPWNQITKILKNL